MAEKLKIAKGDIGNALHSTAKDHVAVVAYETFDEELQEYQSVLNELSVIKDADGNVQQTPFRYIVNEEYIFAMLDAKEHFLAGIHWDGTPQTAKMEENAEREFAAVNKQIESIKTDLKRNVLSISFDRSTGQIIGTTSDRSRITGCVQDRKTGRIFMNHELD